MLRLLVLSDSHGDYISLKMAIEGTSDVDCIVFLGDGADDLEKIRESIFNKKVIAVRGNCDSILCNNPPLIVEDMAGIKVYCTHGYAEKVKFGIQILQTQARSYGASLALYGHTHTPFTGYDDGLYIMNPGSVRENSCGVADITPNGILCFTKKIVT